MLCAPVVWACQSSAGARTKMLRAAVHTLTSFSPSAHTWDVTCRQHGVGRMPLLVPEEPSAVAFLRGKDVPWIRAPGALLEPSLMSGLLWFMPRLSLRSSKMSKCWHQGFQTARGYLHWLIVVIRSVYQAVYSTFAGLFGTPTASPEARISWWISFMNICPAKYLYDVLLDRWIGNLCGI